MPKFSRFKQFASWQLLVRGAMAAVLACATWSATGLNLGSERAPVRLQQPKAEDPSNASVIVKYRAGSALRKALVGRSGFPVQQAPRHAAVLSARTRIPMVDGRVLGPHTQQVRGTGVSSSELARQLTAMPDVEWAAVDHRRYAHSAPNDPYFGPDQTVITPTVGQWYLRAPDSTAVSAINAVAAWDSAAGLPPVTVAVLDTGVRKDHPDLAGKLYEGYDFVSRTNRSNDGNGRDADASDPGDYSTARECGFGVPAENSSWHGTQVSGIVGAASNNGIGIAGTGGAAVMVLPVRVLGACGGSDSDIIAAMRWAAGLTSDVGGNLSVTNDHPAKVLNLSLGSSTSCQQSYLDVLQELTAAGVTVVVSAGNEEGLATDAPANCRGALAVGGLRHIGTKVGFSNVGAEVAISAPAGNCVNTTGACLYPIMTTSNAGTTTPDTTPAGSIYTDSYNMSVGTSFSAPQVSGTVGLMLAINPSLTPDDIRAALQATARPFPTTGADGQVAQCRAPDSTPQDECYCTTSTCGAGMLDAAAAATAAARGIPGPTAVMTVDTSALQSSNTVLLSSAGSTAVYGRTIALYQWSLLSGQQYASFPDGSTSPTAALVFSGTGGVVDLQLQLTDSSGSIGTTHQIINGPVAPPPPPPPPPPTPDPPSPPSSSASSAGSSGGGGSVSALWLAALMLACVALWRTRKPH